MESQKLVNPAGERRMADAGLAPLSMTMGRWMFFTRVGYDTVTECEDSRNSETDYYCSRSPQ
jgi:hypothetical protein